MEKEEMTLTPYLHFEGNCEEALNFYSKILDCKIERINRYETAPMPVPDHYKSKILHAVFRFGNNEIMVSDAFPDFKVENGNRFYLSIGFSNEEKAKNVFAQLGGGGKVEMPLEKQFWGDMFGQLVDRFGICWMVNCTNA